MSTLVIYEEVRFHELVFVPELMGFTYPCPCGDMFTFYIVRLGFYLCRVGRFEKRRAHCNMSKLLLECSTYFRRSEGDGSISQLGRT